MPDTIVDVSPDLPFGMQVGGQNTGGRIVTVAADPQDRLRLYAAGELSGTWTSGDGGRSWRQSARGLGNGNSCMAPPVLAIDPRNHRRLLYTTFEDFRPGGPTTGLYLSTDAALTWRRVPLPVPVGKRYGTVGFAGGPTSGDHPWLLTANGLLVADTTRPVFDSPRQWLLVPGPSTTLGGPGLALAHVVSVGDTIIGCAGNTVYAAGVESLLRARGNDASPWVASAGLPNDFVASVLTLAPVVPGSIHPVLVLGTTGRDSTSILQLWSVDVGVSAAVRVGTLPDPGGSGTVVVGAPPGLRPDGSYDIIVGDGLNFCQAVVINPRRSPQINGEFEQIADVHRDTWSIAFSADYGTSSESPAIYLAHDGGITVRHGRQWVTAMHGLHAYKSANLAGVTVDDVDSLYLPAGDNDLWASRNGGATWESMGNLLGDAGVALVDPRVPGQVAAARNGTVAIYRSPSPLRLTAGGADSRYYAIRGARSGSLTALAPEGGTEPPQNPGLTQILTAPTGDKPVSAGDYITINNGADEGGLAQIVRSDRTSQLPGGAVQRTWRYVTGVKTNPRFAPGSVLAIAASGGHRHPRIYILHSTSHGNELLRSDIDPTSATFEEFTLCSGDTNRGQPTAPMTLHVNPWNRNQLYVWDDAHGNSTIRSSTDGGTTWHEEPALKARATNNGEYSFGFQRSKGTIRCGPLQSVTFSPTNDQMRLAVTFPGGLAFSPNAGANWYAIGDDLRGTGALAGVRSLRDLVAYPYSAYLTGTTDSFRLYIAMLGRGLVRIDTALSTTNSLP
ncbi:beta propeller repeat protein [Microlunatus ginsengisoli]|uniref:Exo-alpha-sialidase n=1 Tax=Microlunatus ginsengisoli TaxID=363863 RepID=A0ABP7AYQ4_9ACTN